MVVRSADTMSAPPCALRRVYPPLVHYLYFSSFHHSNDVA
jgi:hypothetical protein